MKLKVDIADRTSKRGASEALLVQWGIADPTNPAPIRRQIAHHVRQANHAQALALLPELEARGEPVVARRLQVPLALALDPASVTPQPGDSNALKRALHLRQAVFDQTPAAVPPHPSLDEILAVGEQLLAQGNPSHASRRARQVLWWDPWNPTALALQTKAAHQLGRFALAERAYTRLRWVYPDAPTLAALQGSATADGSGAAADAGVGGGGPNTAAENTSVGAQRQTPSP